MQLVFRQRRYFIRQPYPRQILRPVVTVTLIGPSASRALHALLDTGSDHSAFGEKVAGQLGVDLTQSAHVPIKTAAGQVVLARIGDVRMRMMDSNGNGVEWDSKVAFVPVGSDPSLLGYTYCREYFEVTLSESYETLTLVTNHRFPGTTIASRI